MPSKGREAAKALVGQRLAELRRLIEKKQALPRHETAKFIWHTASKLRNCYIPHEVNHWHDAKGMLKELVVWEKFKPDGFMLEMFQNVTEEVAEKVLSRYHNFLITGQIETKHQAPEILGETDRVCFIDKPCGFLCEFGGDQTAAPKLSGGIHGATELLNGPTSRIQIHEYLAKRLKTEVSRATQEFWRSDQPPECTCQACEKCCAYIAGVCHRLDVETSGVMVVAKKLSVFSELRTSINHKAKGGAKKFYLAIANGKLLAANDSDEGGWGTSNVPMKWDTEHGKSVQWDDVRDAGKEGVGRDTGGRCEALTYFRPLKYFSGYTLLQLQIVTGARHQIRFHCSAMGHPLVGDVKYGAPFKDRDWAGRVALHAYRVEMYEPETGNYLKAVAPLPPDLLKILLQLEQSNDATELPGAKEERHLWTTEDHPQLGSLFQKSKPLFSCERPGVVSPPLAPWHAQGREASPSVVSTPPPWRNLELPMSTMSPPPPWPRRYPSQTPKTPDLKPHASLSPPAQWPPNSPVLHASLSPPAQWPAQSPVTPWLPTSVPVTPRMPTAVTQRGADCSSSDNDGRIERLRVAAKRRREAKQETQETKEEARVLHLRFLVLRRRLAKQKKEELLGVLSGQ